MSPAESPGYPIPLSDRMSQLRLSVMIDSQYGIFRRCETLSYTYGLAAFGAG